MSRGEICLAASLSLHHVAFSNNYSVHCCAHIMLGRGPHIRTHAHTHADNTHAQPRQRNDFRSKSPPRFRPVYSASDPSADCVRQSAVCGSFPIMAAAAALLLLPGPSSPLLFFGKREPCRQTRRREGLTQRRPHTTAAGRC